MLKDDGTVSTCDSECDIFDHTLACYTTCVGECFSMREACASSIQVCFGECFGMREACCLKLEFAQWARLSHHHRLYAHVLITFSFHRLES